MVISANVSSLTTSIFFGGSLSVSVITEVGVTSAPVPDVVGIAIKYLTFLRNPKDPSGSIIKRFTLGFSYLTIIILVASITLPPPIAIKTFGLNSSQTLTPSSITGMGTSGITFGHTLYSISIDSN